MRIIRATAKQVCRFSNFRGSVSFFLAEVTDIAMTAVQFLREIVGFTGSGGAAHIVKVHPRKNEAHDDEPAGMPRPSIAEYSIVFFDANASARPSTMQFTTISGMKIPSAL